MADRYFLGMREVGRDVVGLETCRMEGRELGEVYCLTMSTPDLVGGCRWDRPDLYFLGIRDL